MPQDGAPSSIDVLAAQVREGIWEATRTRDALALKADAALDALVARVTEAEQRLATAGQNASRLDGNQP